MKAIKRIIFLILISAIAVVGWKNKDFLMEKAEDIKVEMAADKIMNDLRKSDTEHFGEHTDRNEFDAILTTVRLGATPEPLSSGIIHLDPMLPVEDAPADYPKEVFFRYTGIEDVDRVKFVSVDGPCWEEQFLVYENDDIYSREKFYAMLVLANSAEDAEIVLEQIKENLNPLDWDPTDRLTDDRDGSSLFINIPHECQDITEEDMHYYRNGEYILFVINDKAAIEEGTQNTMEYLIKLLDAAIEETREYYES